MIEDGGEARGDRGDARGRRGAGRHAPDGASRRSRCSPATCRRTWMRCSRMGGQVGLNFLRFEPPKRLEKNAEGNVVLPPIRFDRALDYLIGDWLK